jgi:hypothetical protein
MDLRYHGRSGVREAAWGAAMTFEPNLSRSKVFFDGEIADPLRFREAISALHAVVVGDLRYKQKDRSAHTAWLEAEKAREDVIRSAVHDETKKAEILKIAKEPLPPGIEVDFRKMHSLYWTARRRWANELAQNDPELFRHLVPCDPVVTVAPDVVMFECFAKDEASYGCLSVDRDGFKAAGDSGIGTTNVDYSLALFEHFQTIRSYRPTRLLVDPTGFEVAVQQGGTTLREEKIDLPASWLRGFGQLQAAMAIPARKVELSTDVVYSILAFLRSRREKSGPRSLRFVLAPGKPVQVVIEPWGTTLVSRGAVYAGERAEEIKVWGRRRLLAFARSLAFAEKFDVQLLGTGLPSVWTARLGAMRLTLALSGWTANDWSRGSNLDQYFGGFQATPGAVDAVATHLVAARSATLAELVRVANEPEKVVLGSLHELAKRGQLAYDFATGVYRWRPILDVALSESMLGPEPEEVVVGRALAKHVKIEREQAVGNKRLLVAKVGETKDKTSCEAVVDTDGVFANAKCSCSYFFRFKLRAGPCRHLLALRIAATRAPEVELPVATVRKLPPEVAAAQAVPAGIGAGPAFERQALALQLTAATADAIAMASRATGIDAAEIVEKAWRDGRKVAGTWQRVPTPTAPKTPQTFSLTERTVRELQAEAGRLDVSVSNLFEAVWAAVRGGGGSAPN